MKTESSLNEMTIIMPGTPHLATAENQLKFLWKIEESIIEDSFHSHLSKASLLQMYPCSNHWKGC